MSSASGVRNVIIKIRPETMESLKEKINRLDPRRMPVHVAMIMDGNGRWAQKRAKERTDGHYEGVGSVHRVTQFSSDLGIKYLTLYGFSTENWNRPKEEVDILMHLIGVTVERETPDLIKNNVKLNLIGDLKRIPEESLQRLLRSEQATSQCTGLVLSMALSYSARWELTQAARRIAEKTAAGELDPASINEEVFASHLETAGIPDPDLLIRTGGDERVSNYLLWQIAYSELYFTPVLWPDFSDEDYVDAILDYQGRERRFGKTGDQIKTSK